MQRVLPPGTLLTEPVQFVQRAHETHVRMELNPQKKTKLVPHVTYRTSKTSYITGTTTLEPPVQQHQAEGTGIREDSVVGLNSVGAVARTRRDALYTLIEKVKRVSAARGRLAMEREASRSREKRISSKAQYLGKMSSFKGALSYSRLAARNRLTN